MQKQTSSRPNKRIIVINSLITNLPWQGGTEEVGFNAALNYQYSKTLIVLRASGLKATSTEA